MNEYQPPHNLRAERSHEVRPAREHGEIDWRRIEVAMHRFGDHLAHGINQAMAEHREVDHGTARVIAHVLGRGYGRASALAEYGRTGEGDYLTLRDEYLDIYGHEQADSMTRELIDWFGTHLIQHEHTGSQRRYMNEHLPPRLEQLLVRTPINIGRETFTVHVPATLSSADIAQVRDRIVDLGIQDDEELQAFVSLPDVAADAQNLREALADHHIAAFDSIEDALTEIAEVDQLERDVLEYAEEHHMIIEELRPDYHALRETADGGYDFVDWKGRVHVFYR